jgi:hypothetical protein
MTQPIHHVHIEAKGRGRRLPAACSDHRAEGRNRTPLPVTVSRGAPSGPCRSPLRLRNRLARPRAGRSRWRAEGETNSELRPPAQARTAFCRPWLAAGHARRSSRDGPNPRRARGRPCVSSGGYCGSVRVCDEGPCGSPRSHAAKVAPGHAGLPRKGRDDAKGHFGHDRAPMRDVLTSGKHSRRGPRSG